MVDLFRTGKVYKNTLRAEMLDIANKMESRDYSNNINLGKEPIELVELLEFVVGNSKYYNQLLSDRHEIKLNDFPVMNKVLLNENYEAIKVHAYDNMITHKMHTSGSTGIPFTVIQNAEKRERHIADLKYFGALADYWMGILCVIYVRNLQHLWKVKPKITFGNWIYVI